MADRSSTRDGPVLAVGGCEPEVTRSDRHRPSLLSASSELLIPREDEPIVQESRSIGFLEGKSMPLMDRLETQNCIGSVIILNLVCIGLQTDRPGPYWVYAEASFVLFYLIEMIARVSAHGAVTVFWPWNAAGKLNRSVFLNIFDLWLLISGCVDTVLTLAGCVTLVHVLLYVRLLRVLRIFRLFDVLARFVGALANMLSSLIWVFSVLTLVAYVFAVMLAHYSKACGVDRDYFADVPSAMFALFQVTTMDSWPDIAEPLVSRNGFWRLFFVAFIAFSAWTMISLLTAIVSDSVMQATQDKKEKQKEQEEKMRILFVAFLQEAFQHADMDGNGVLDKDEFAALMDDEAVTAKMEELGVTLPKDESCRVFDMLDVDEDGELTIDEFTHGFAQLQQTLTTKHVVSLDYSLQRVQVKVARRMQRLEEKMDESSSRQERMIGLLEKLGEDLLRVSGRVEELAGNVSRIDDSVAYLQTQRGVHSPFKLVSRQVSLRSKMSSERS
uniref:EF-hand domain-containing protein n=1 Tax=Pyrodinium bahamense TaxID=73915 RepID=A0A7S0FTK8_9DINO|mmetsp:Transcript_46508/g.129380  ORF Transcript_46508/g.129380 Transcript_46508/m.129380 type:complete len:499 (+) Transcript_46508:86-1582(+)